MALTEYQIGILRLLADNRRQKGVSYIAGGAALNHVLQTPRQSHDLDIFHDTTEALHASFEEDQTLLLKSGHAVDILRAFPSFYEAEISKDGMRVLMQWARDSAYRFFPLVEDEILGLTLHSFDLATNKILAMAGRLEPRDWIDTMECSRSIQRFGYLVWAACGKDPGVNPDMVLAEASRLHYSRIEIETIAFEKMPADLVTLSAEWKEMIVTGKEILQMLPEEHLGECVLNTRYLLYNSNPADLARDIGNNAVLFHRGTIGGAWPQIVGQSR